MTVPVDSELFATLVAGIAVLNAVVYGRGMELPVKVVCCPLSGDPPGRCRADQVPADRRRGRVAAPAAAELEWLRSVIAELGRAL